MSNILKYEMFIRHAFNVNRGEDPAALADQDYVSVSTGLPKIKAASAYATYICQHKYSEILSEYDENIDKVVDNIFKATTVSEVMAQIDIILKLLDQQDILKP